MKVTVITACYNSEKTITSCVNSVLAQDYENLEHLIIDGASTDKTLEIVESLSNDKVRIISEKDDGIYDALNKGVKNATGDVVGFLHADDLFASDSVITQVADCLSDSSVDACYSDLVYVNPETDEVVRYWQSSEFRKGLFLKGWMPPHPTVYVRKEVYAKLGVFNTGLPIGADWDLVRVLVIGMVGYIYKFTMAIILTPLIYLAHHLIDSYLGHELAEKMKTEAQIA